jgi:hypothetical protein
MRTTETVSETREVTRTTDVLCNLCGGTCRLPSLPNQYVGAPNGDGYYGMIEAVATGGYQSESLEDMTYYRFSLCEGCLAELFARCKIPVERGEYFLGNTGNGGLVQCVPGESGAPVLVVSASRPRGPG